MCLEVIGLDVQTMMIVPGSIINIGLGDLYGRR